MITAYGDEEGRNEAVKNLDMGMKETDKVGAERQMVLKTQVRNKEL